jgi:hypothetical protein
VSLWRKRGASDTNRDTIAPNVHYNGQNQPKWFNMTALANNDLSIKSDDLSIKSEKAMCEVQRLGQEIQGEHMIWVDPPEGWKYGFPAIYDPNTDGQLSDWIVRKGYPLQTIKEYGDAWAVRCWPAEEPH